MKKALITGITGQDGAYLAEFLLSKGYEVHGIKRRSSSFNTARVDHLYRDPHETDVNFIMHYGDLTDATNLIRIIQEVKPAEIYNLAAQSHVKVSFETPEYTANSDALGALRILEAIRILGLENTTRFYQASTSEMYGKIRETPQTENTPFYPRSPYGAAKVYAYWITVNYREAYDMFACNGILFNHESPIRGETFVTRKITRAVARMYLGLQKVLYLGNLDSKRDWGDARDYIRAMWMMLQADKAEDYVIATGVAHSVREFVEKAFREVGIGIAWKGSNIEEIGVIKRISEPSFEKKDLQATSLQEGDVVVKIDPGYFRPTEVDFLMGDATKAKEKLGWEPEVAFEKLVHSMVHADIHEAMAEDLCRREGFSTYNHFE